MSEVKKAQSYSQPAQERGDDALPEDEVAMWRDAARALLEKGATQAEAIDGANLVLRAYRRQRHRSSDVTGGKDGGTEGGQGR